MNEAKIDNLLAKKVVDNPNELSGARPASAANSNTNGAANGNTASTNTSAVSPANSTSAERQHKCGAEDGEQAGS